MTNKQIIIDGVDVSGCIVFDNKWGTPLCNPTEDIREAVHCSDYPDCLFKKFKRKEQECENWKCELDKTHLLMLEKQDKLLKSMQECERLKEENNKYKNAFKKNARIFKPC